MAWIYFQESVASGSFSKTTLEQSPTVNVIDMHRAYFCPECGQVTLIELRSGMTSEHCDPICCQKSISSTEDFPARTLVLQEMVEAWQASEVDFSSKLSDLQKKLTRRLCSSKTSPQLELEDFEKSSEHLPIYGMTVAGRVYLPLKLEPRTLEKDGFCWPTPTASEGAKGSLNRRYGDGSMTLSAAIMWRTPMASDWKNRGADQYRKQRGAQTQLQTQVGGQLSPMWVEWLMGYPIGWTELSVSAMLWFRSKRKSRLKD